MVESRHTFKRYQFDIDAVVGFVAGALVLADVGLGKKFGLQSKLQFIRQSAASVFLAVKSVAAARQGFQTPRRVAYDRDQALVALGNVGPRLSALHLLAIRRSPRPIQSGSFSAPPSWSSAHSMPGGFH